MKLKTIITVSGKISSGKSFISNMIQKEFGISIASFGGYLRYYCELNSLPIDRKTLQDFGEKFIKENSNKFLVDVLTHFAKDKDLIILEGVRHKAIFDEFVLLAHNHISIYVEADVKTRFERYIGRNKDVDVLKTFDQFLTADNHPVEIEIEALKKNCEIVVDSGTEYWQYLHSELQNKLTK